ncbi:MAG: VOC family protein [Neoaquamicrobium sediminum]|uniref:VOC family protein n=1 Tax=Neoaquamicrobium sediminum TaxID=1849104 RepID=UPI00403584FF
MSAGGTQMERPMLGRLATVAIVVGDYDEAVAWYRDRLGLDVVEDTDMGEGKRWVVVAPSSRAGARILLAKASGEAQQSRIGNQTGGRVGFFFETDDFAHDHARMIAEGIVFQEEPRHEPYGTVAVFADLYGNLFDLIEPRTAAATKE